MAKMRPSNPGSATGFDMEGGGKGKMKDFGFSGSLGHGHEPAMPKKAMPAHKASMNVEHEFGGQKGSMKEFGFGASAEPMDEPTHASGAPVQTVHHPDGTIEHHHADGGHTVHHSDGGITIHHADGGKTHHHAFGGHIHYHAHGGVTHVHPDGTTEHHDSSEMAHGGACYAGGGEVDGDETQDKQMVSEGIGQHENHLHGGKHTTLHLRRGGPAKEDGEHYAMGGMVPGAPMPVGPAMARQPMAAAPMMNQRVPGMKRGGHVGKMPMKAGMTHRKLPPEPPVGDGPGPINRPPRNPMKARTKPNDMPGGQMPYGVQPSTEDDSNPPDFGSSAGPGAPGASGMKRGGRVHGGKY